MSYIGDNDSSFTSVSQQADNTQIAVKESGINLVTPFKENFLNETIVDEKNYLKTQEASELFVKIQAEKEALKQELKTKRKDVNMKQFDEATKDYIKASKRSKDVFETVYDDFTAIAAAADNLERSSTEIDAFLEAVNEFFSLSAPAEN